MERKKFFIGMVMGFFLICFFPMTVFAKTYAGDIDNVPSSAEVDFRFTFSVEQQYDITLIDSSGNQYRTTERGSEIVVVVNDSLGGTYDYTIIAGNQCDYDISVVDVGKGLSEVTESKPTVTAQVTNLELILQDGELVATWNYDGKVNITVSDPSKFYQLSGVSTQENEYRLEMPDNIESFVFYIVPSTDAKVPGAGLSYTKQVVREVNASVSFPSVSLLNTTTVRLPITIADANPVRVMIYNNSFVAGESRYNDTSIKPVVDETVGAGEYEIDFPLTSTRNNIVVCFVDNLGNAQTYSYGAVRDIQSPTIDLKKLSLDNNSSYQNYSTSNDTVVIKGAVYDEIAAGMTGEIAKLEIDGYDVAIDENGRFSFEQSLVLGVNQIKIVATDLSGNQSEFVLSVTMTEPKHTDIIVYVVVIGLLFFFGIGGYFLIVRIRSRYAFGGVLTSKEVDEAERAEEELLRLHSPEKKKSKKSFMKLFASAKEKEDATESGAVPESRDEELGEPEKVDLTEEDILKGADPVEVYLAIKKNSERRDSGDVW